MIVTKGNEKVFEPIKISIVFQSQEEVDKFYQIFNYVPLCDFFNRDNARNIRSSLDSSVKDSDPKNLESKMKSHLSF